MLCSYSEVKICERYSSADTGVSVEGNRRYFRCWSRDGEDHSEVGRPPAAHGGAQQSRYPHCSQWRILYCSMWMCPLQTTESPCRSRLLVGTSACGEEPTQGQIFWQEQPSFISDLSILTSTHQLFDVIFSPCAVEDGE